MEDLFGKLSNLPPLKEMFLLKKFLMEYVKLSEIQVAVMELFQKFLLLAKK